MCVGVPAKVLSIRGDGRADCEDAAGAQFPYPVQTSLLDAIPLPGSWLLVHIDTAIQCLTEREAREIADAFEALELAVRGEDFEHLLGDLANREPELPEHLKLAPEQHTASSATLVGREPETGVNPNDL